MIFLVHLKSWIFDIDGNYMVGGGGGSIIFFYNGITWTILGLQGMPCAISGSCVITGAGIYNLESKIFTGLNFPESSYTWLEDIDGDNIVGYYFHEDGIRHGFLYDGTAWITLDYPGASLTMITGIDGYNIVGTYHDASGNKHGFIATIPEPATIILFIFGGLVFQNKRTEKIWHR